MLRVRPLAAVCLWLATVAVTAPVRAQAPGADPANLRGESTQTRKRLVEAEQKLAAGETSEAVEALQRILDEAGDDLVTLDGRHYHPARTFAHQLLARLPADALRLYQDRIDEPARRLLEAARRSRSPAPLWQLIDRYFVSRATEEGLLLLGDLLFEAGDYRGAEQVWGRLAGRDADLNYPGRRADPAAVEARLVLAACFQGEVERARAALTAFRNAYPGARGSFAGRDGSYAEILETFLDSPRHRTLPGNPGRDWPTFGGGPDRGGRVNVRLPSQWTGRPWVATIPPVTRHPDAPPAPPARPPFGHPVVANGQVFVTDGNRLFGFDLLTGEPTGSFSVGRPVPFQPKPPADACPSLTAWGDRLYLRIGPTVVRPPDPTVGRAGGSWLVCLTQTEDRKLRELWRVGPPGGATTPAVWEGAPLLAGRRMWAAYARFEGGRVVHGVACFDPADRSSAPEQPTWTVEVADSPLPASTSGEGRVRHELLTLAGRHVVFCTNAGAVVAVEATTGRRAWGFRYPRSAKADILTIDPAPAVATGGRLFVAPCDADRVYALDPESGRLLWESGPTEGAQLLGVADGKLIVTVTGPVRGIRGLDLVSGSQREPVGWVQHDADGLLSYGRGFVTDDVIVWPTRNGLFFLNPRDGFPIPSLTTFPHPAGGTSARFYGNVVYADGVMVVVTATQVWGYVSERRRFGPAPERSQRGLPSQRFRSLVAAGEAALGRGDPTAAQEAYRAAAADDFPTPLRAWAVARLLALAPADAQATALPADLVTLVEPGLRDEWLLTPDGMPTTLGALLDHRPGRPPPARASPLPAVRDVGRDPEDGHDLGPDLRIVRTLRLPPGSAPLRGLTGTTESADRLFVVTPGEVWAVPRDDGRPITRYAAVDGVTHAAAFVDGVVVAGPSVVAVYSNGREPDWVFRVPTTEPLPAAPGELRLYTDEPTTVPELSSFHLAGTWLVARWGERHLIAFDLSGHRVAWVLGANGRPGFRPVVLPDSPRIGPVFAAVGRVLVVQLSNGRRWFVRVETGKVLDVPGFDQPTSRVWWSVPPAEVELNRLVVSDGPGLVRMLNLVTGRVKWTRHEAREASLAGDPPQVRAWGETVLLAVRRNHGVELERIDLSEGRSLWSCGAAFLDADRIDLTDADADADRVYVAAGGSLVAIRLTDGRELWQARLAPDGDDTPWVVRAGKHGILAIPKHGLPREPLHEVARRVWRSFRREPKAARLPALLLRLYDAWIVRTVPVLLLDPQTGRRLAEVRVPAAGPPVTIGLAGDRTVIATGDRIVWLR